MDATPTWLLWTVVAWVALAGLGGQAVRAQDGGHAEITIEAREQGCPQGHRWCLVATEGNLSTLEQGQRIEITLVNQGNSGHQLSVAHGEDQDPDHEDTPSAAAFFTIDRVPAERSATGTLEVPEEAKALYLWCDVPGHEQGGMWIEVPVTETERVPGEDRSTPVGATVALVSIGLAGLWRAEAGRR